jgi:hypothetical protein
MALTPSTHQQAFEKIKKVIGKEVLLCYPDFNKPVNFHLYTDASDHQLGVVIMQDRNAIAFYSQKINTSQKRYTTTKKKQRVVISYWNLQGWKEYKNILLCYHAPIIVFTDHKNNTFNGLKASDRVFRWLLLLEEYGVKLEYLPGKKNVVADALSRLGIDSLKIQEEEVSTLLSGSENNCISNINSTIPMHTALIFKEQAKLKGLREKGLAQTHYSIQHIEGYELLCYKENIYIPQALRQTKKSTVLVPWIFTSSGTD